MIEVRNLSKYYGNITAIDNINFTIQKGEIIGFLGPNGAGKTTTMKILTCFMRPSSGDVKIAGYDIYENPLKIKKYIGYLPESNPLYYDMTVENYLKYIGHLKELKKNSLKKSILSVAKKCGLNSVLSRKIANLSKGYKQRVGIAQAIINDPPILILDEPTSGLDPNQIIEIRELIKELGKEKTVILSTHILHEVESTCNRIIIINKGKLIIDSNKDELKKESKDKREFLITIKTENVELLKEKFSSANEILEIKEIKTLEKNIFTINIITSSENTVNDKIFNICAENNFIIYELKKVEHSLEDIFKQLTS